MKERKPTDPTPTARDRFADLLGTVEDMDEPALELLAAAWAEWQDADEKVRAQGLVVKLPNGWPGPNPYLPIRTKAALAVTRLLREFGMTPASRAKIKAAVGMEEAEPAELEY